MSPKEVIIDGVRYIPVPVAIEADNLAARLRRALVAIYWGEGTNDKRVREYAQQLYVTISDKGEEGEDTIDNFVGKILEDL